MALQLEEHPRPAEADHAEHLVDLAEAGVVEEDAGAAVRCGLQGEADTSADPGGWPADAVAGEELARGQGRFGGNRTC
jgi:hypothetical protein